MGLDRPAGQTELARPRSGRMERIDGIRHMRISCISFTANGSRINRRLESWLEAEGNEVEARALARYASDAGVKPLEGKLADFCRTYFDWSDVMIFIGAAGIAVRGIAPYVKDKKTDPAVLVIDEQGNFVISLLSGHIGGANEMAGRVAAYLDAVPVITTGTDVNHTLAVDVFAARNHLIIGSMEMAKEMAARLIDKEPVGFISDLEVAGPVSPAVVQMTGSEHSGMVLNGTAEHDNPGYTDYDGAGRLNPAESPEAGIPKAGIPKAGIPEAGIPEAGIHVSWKTEAPFTRTLKLYPRCVHLGIGCKRDTPEAVIEEKVETALDLLGLDRRCIAGAASIDLKKDEVGLKVYLEKRGIPFSVYTSQELTDVPGDFTPSRFVGSITGVDNVCERAAALDCIRNRIYANDENKTGSYRMILRKQAGGGVTVAAAIEDWSVRFE